MLTYAFFLSNRRESLVRAFRKKTPLSVRRPGGGGAKGDTESVHRNMTFFYGFPYHVSLQATFGLFLDVIAYIAHSPVSVSWSV